MLINWFTVAAQAINFLILVWLLKRFLYKPILLAIDQREKGIAAQYAEVGAKEAAAQKDRDDLQHKNEAFDRERTDLLKKATDDASAKRQQLLDEARNDADSLRAKRQEALRNEQRDLSQKITHWSQQQVFAVARRTLADLANASLEQRVGEVFVQRLRSLTGAAKDQLAAALKSSAQPARVRSAFDLPSALRSEIENAVKETFEVETQIQFETAPNVVSGIELSTGGRKVAWSIADYLTTLERSVGDLLHEDAKPETEPQPESKAKPDTPTESKPASKVEAQPEPKAQAKPEPRRESKNGVEPVAAAPRADV